MRTWPTPRADLEADMDLYQIELHRLRILAWVQVGVMTCLMAGLVAVLFHAALL
jgi:hypothetical protein